MDLLSTLFYLLFCSCVVYPPTEFVTAGFTVVQLLEPWLGTESSDFVTHHVKRTCATVLVHSLLPLGYILCLMFSGWEPDGGVLTHAILTVIITIPLVALYKVYEWSRDGFRMHPIARNLIAYSNSSDWYTVAVSINDEFKRVDKILIQMNSINKVIVTNAWIIKTSPYTVCFAHQSDSTLEAVSTDTHELSVRGQSGDRQVQYVRVEVKPGRTGASPFHIRVNTQEFKDLQDKMSRPITVLPTVTFQASTMERFIQVFKTTIQFNPVYTFEQELEACIGCMQNTADVKIRRSCEDLPEPAISCTECHCRPMWCAECLARWWVSRQEQDTPGTWLQSRCTCPLCRATFCTLDVAYVQQTAGALRARQG